MATLEERAWAAVNRVAKWRGLFTGWQLGTRPKGDPECDAVSDAREALILLRVDVNALAALQVRKGVFTTDEWWEQLRVEADVLNGLFERRFPGVQASLDGLHMDERVGAWMSGWKP